MKRNPTSEMSPFAALRRFICPDPPAQERCELCSTAIAAEHPHLLELEKRRIVCSCDPCALLFPGRQNARYRRVPRVVQHLKNFHMTDPQWSSLLIPINMAFFFHHSEKEKVIALYPSPAGATESLLPLETWTRLVEENPVLHELEPDVESLLVNRVGEARDYYRVGIDECYKLVGIIRAGWRGFSGGTEVWEEIHRFFHQLQKRSTFF